MNYFFAIKPSQEICDTLTEYAERWRSLLGNQRFHWYVPQDYHITLKFLGDLNPPDEERLITAALPISHRTQPFSIQLAGPSAWPNPDRFANVLVNGIYNSARLNTLHHDLSQAMAQQGIAEKKRPYSPHITFARCNRRETDIQFVKFEHVFQRSTVDKFALMQTLPPEQRRNDLKARYNTVHLFPLGDPPSSAE